MSVLGVEEPNPYCSGAALKEYGMPELYAKIPRDALLMIIFNERPGSVLEVNELLQKNGMLPLRTSGLQE